MAIFLTILATTVLTVPLHDFPLGHVERALNVVVRQNQVDIEYAIGMSDETAIHLYANGDQSDQARSEANESDGSQADSTEARIVAEEVLDDADTKSIVEQSNDQPLGDQLGNETRVLKMLSKRAPQEILKRLVLTFDGEEVPLEIVEASPSSRHHVSLLIRIRAKMPVGRVFDFKLADDNYLMLDGDSDGVNAGLAISGFDLGSGALANNSICETEVSPVAGDEKQFGVDKNREKDEFILAGTTKMALRAKGKAVLLQSNVAPVLARAKPIEIFQLGIPERQEVCSIVARIGIASDLESKDK
jgi:hypothetical protein